MKHFVSNIKILSIDGGGIKGLYSSTILEHLERKYGNMSTYFDLICGTSTGGLIALALSLGIPATEISKMYMQKGAIIFPKINKLMGIVRQTLWRGKYSDEPLKKVLHEFFGDRRMSDLQTLVCIPSYCLTDASPWIFKKDHGKLYRDNDTLITDVALATTAAPTYFPLAEVAQYDNKQFIDGGVWANNPALIGVIEALSYLAIPESPDQQISVLSLSSLNNTGGKPVGISRFRPFVKWRNDLFETSMIGQSYFTDFTMKKLAELSQIKINYARIPSEPVSAEQQHLVQLDCAIPKAIQFIRGKGNDRGFIASNAPEIEQFFKEEKQSKI